MVVKNSNDFNYPSLTKECGNDTYGAWFDLAITSNKRFPINRYKYNPDPILRFRWCNCGEVSRDKKSIDKYSLPEKISIKSGFWLSETTVTQKIWRYIMGSNHKSFYKGSNLPVNDISLTEINDFIKKINTRFKSGYFSLPTEDQWEYACRAGTTTPYHWVVEIAKNNIHYFSYEKYLNKKLKIQPAKFFVPNSWGFFQMHGNIGEWTVTNDFSVIKGGHYLNFFEDCTSSQRSVIDNNDFSIFFTQGKISASGFRLVFNNTTLPAH